MWVYLGVSWGVGWKSVGESVVRDGKTVIAGKLLASVGKRWASGC